MIIDNVAERAKYYSVNPRFESAFAFIEKAVKENLPAGKYIIEDNALFASVQEYETKDEEKCRFEAHRKYIDIQYIVIGEEIMESMKITGATPSTEYRDDVQFFEKSQVLASGVVSQGEYAIFFPSDVHRSGIFAKSPATVKKIVVKVLA